MSKGKKYNAKYFRDRLPEWKRKRDPIMVRYLYRPVSFFSASWCANRGIGANAVSNFSTVIAAIACVLLAIPSLGAGIAGAVLMNIWIILDCTDGNLARQVKKEAYGEFLDAMSSYILSGGFFLAVGFRVCQMGVILPQYNIYLFLLGALTSVFQNLMVLLYQKYLNVSYGYGRNEKLAYDGSNSSTLIKLRTVLDMNMSVGGIIPMVILVCCMLNVCEIVLVIWFFYYTAEFLASIVYLLHKVKIGQREIEVEG